jgi:hypothetical protein
MVQPHSERVAEVAPQVLAGQHLEVMEAAETALSPAPVETELQIPAEVEADSGLLVAALPGLEVLVLSSSATLVLNAALAEP